MDYDFFNDNNQPQEEGEKKHTLLFSENPPVPKKRRPWGKIISSICLAVVIFFCGMLTAWSMLDPEIRTLLAVKNRIQKEYYKEVTDEDFYKAIFGGINNNLLDAYSGYMTPEEFAQEINALEGNHVGIGLMFAEEENSLRITRVGGNSPAEEAGVKAGETIIGVGSTENEMLPCATFADFVALDEKYEVYEEFYLKLRFKDTERTVKVYKAPYVENFVFYRTNKSAYAFTGVADLWTEKGSPLTYLDNDTAYIRLVQFTGNAQSGFDVAMSQFKKDGKKNLILDLRTNGGGYVDTMQSIASYFCKNTTEKTPLAAVADYGEKREQYRATGNYYTEYFGQDSRIYVLADRYSASATESLLGCMIDYGTITYQDICLSERNGVAKTYGKGIMQATSLVNIFQQDAITLTTAEIRWPISGISIHGRGILPQDGTRTVAEDFDDEKELENAIKTLLG